MDLHNNILTKQYTLAIINIKKQRPIYSTISVKKL